MAATSTIGFGVVNFMAHSLLFSARRVPCFRLEGQRGRECLQPQSLVVRTVSADAIPTLNLLSCLTNASVVTAPAVLGVRQRWNKGPPAAIGRVSRMGPRRGQAIKP